MSEMLENPSNWVIKKLNGSVFWSQVLVFLPTNESSYSQFNLSCCKCECNCDLSKAFPYFVHKVSNVYFAYGKFFSNTLMLFI